MARCAAQLFQNLFYKRKMVEYPRRRDGESIASMYKRERVSQLYGMLVDMFTDVRMVKNLNSLRSESSL